jgi:mannose-1-phosphate guanylyltransferase
MKSFKAMILAAGLATRLRPLTYSRPKVLIPIQNRPLLNWLVEFLWSSGAEEVIVNGHHLSEKLVDSVQRENFPIPVYMRVEEVLLGTGGGIRNVADFWDERPFVVINGDILTSIDLREVCLRHESSGAMATLVLKDEPRFNRVQVTDDGRILSFTGGPEKLLAFTGINVLNPEILAVIPADIPVSIIDCYLQLISKGKKVMAYVAKEQYWRELGSLEGYLQAHQEFFRLRKTPVQGLQVGGKPVVHESVRLGHNTRLDGMVCIGQECELDSDVIIQESVLWDQVRVMAGCSIRRSIIGDGVVVTESLEGVVVDKEGRAKLTAGKEKLE